MKRANEPGGCGGGAVCSVTNDLACSPYPLSGVRFEGKHPKVFFLYFGRWIDIDNIFN